MTAPGQSPDPTRPPVLGLTGNIATGKSLVAAHLRDLGAIVIDSDLVVRRLYRRTDPVARAVAARFGPHLLGPAGIDRRALGQMVFGNSEALTDLEAIVHPAVIAEVAGAIARAPAGQPHVIEAIKLAESGNALLLDELWVLDSPRTAQIARLVSSRGLSREQVRLRIDSQSSAEDKLALFARRRPGTRARLIENAGSRQSLLALVGRSWWNFLSARGGAELGRIQS